MNLSTMVIFENFVFLNHEAAMQIFVFTIKIFEIHFLYH